MKKIFIKLFSIILIVGILTILINMAYVHASHGKDYDGDYTDKFMSIEGSIEISNTGSSHGLRAFNYDDIEEYDCFNFALVSQSLSYDYRLVSYYSDQLADNGVMFIPISYFSFFGTDETMEKDFVSKDRRYYKILPPDMIKGYDFKTDLFTNYLPALDSYEKFAMPFVGYVPVHEPLGDIGVMGFGEKELENAGYERAKYHIITGKIDEYGERIINYNEIESCYDIIRLCESKNIRPILITTPYLCEYTQAVDVIDADFMNDFTGIIDEIKTRTGTEYYNYSEDARFCERYDLFSDMDHLNAEGAKVFTKMVIDELVATENETGK